MKKEIDKPLRSVESPILHKVHWQNHAGCREVPPETFFPLATPGTEQHERESAPAREICLTACEVPGWCFLFATEVGAVGIWGGTDEKERAAIRENFGLGDDLRAFAEDMQIELAPDSQLRPITSNIDEIIAEATPIIPAA